MSHSLHSDADQCSVQCKNVIVGLLTHLNRYRIPLTEPTKYVPNTNERTKLILSQTSIVVNFESFVQMSEKGKWPATVKRETFTIENAT